MRCMVCAADAVEALLDVGAHPVSTFFLADPFAPELHHRLALGQCGVCATVQLLRPVNHAHLVPPYPWISYREPEEHLDQAVAKLVKTCALGPDAVIAGLSYKDDTTLDRFRDQHGFSNIWRVNVHADLGAENPNANIESVQARTTPAALRAVAARRGQVDVLVVRHIIEHAEDLGAFLGGLAELVKPGGYVMVECPDCRRNLDLSDACMIWEEHSLYFTPATFEHVCSTAGFETVSLDNYPLPFENCLVLVARKSGAARAMHVSAAAQAERGLLAQYARRHGPIRAQLRAHLEAERAKGPIALFGAGHLACAFVLFYGLSDLVDFVADDTPQKQGLHLPGARIPILPSAALVERGVRLALLAVSPSSEARIAERNQAFLAAGGRFRSILAASESSIRREFSAAGVAA